MCVCEQLIPNCKTVLQSHQQIAVLPATPGVSMLMAVYPRQETDSFREQSISFKQGRDHKYLTETCLSFFSLKCDEQMGECLITNFWQDVLLVLWNASSKMQLDSRKSQAWHRARFQHNLSRKIPRIFLWLKPPGLFSRGDMRRLIGEITFNPIRRWSNELELGKVHNICFTCSLTVKDMREA